VDQIFTSIRFHRIIFNYQIAIIATSKIVLLVHHRQTVRNASRDILYNLVLRTIHTFACNVHLNAKHVRHQMLLSLPLHNVLNVILAIYFKISHVYLVKYQIVTNVTSIKQHVSSA